MDTTEQFLQLCALAEVCDGVSELESLLVGIRDVNETDELGLSPLWHAVEYNEHVCVIETFLNAGAEVTFDIVSEAVIHNRNPQVAKLLFKKLDQVSQKERDLLFLLAAAANTHDHLVRFFLDAGASTDATMPMDLYLDPPEELWDEGEYDSLWNLDDQEVAQNALVVAMYENPEPAGMLRTLLSLGVNPNAVDSEGFPVLIHALDNPDLVQILLDGGSNPATVDQHGMNALMHACASDVHNSALVILPHIDDVNAISHTGETALHYALGCHLDDNVAVVAALIEAGSDVNKPDGDGLLPLEIARFNYCSQLIIDLLISNGAHMGEVS